MLEEARRVYPFRKLNSLNTVGYKELFKYLDGEWTLDFAIEKIKRNSRVYARKQMTWFKRDTDIRWFHPDEKEAILCYLDAPSTPACDTGRFFPITNPKLLYHCLVLI